MRQLSLVSAHRWATQAAYLVATLVCSAASPVLAEDGNDSNVIIVSPLEQASLGSSIRFGDPNAPAAIIFINDYIAPAGSRADHIYPVAANFFDYLLPRLNDDFVRFGTAAVIVSQSNLDSPVSRIAECLSDNERRKFVVDLNTERPIPLAVANDAEYFTGELLRLPLIADLTLDDDCDDLWEATSSDFEYQPNPASQRNRMVVGGLYVADTSRPEQEVSAVHIMQFDTDSPTHAEMLESVFQRLASEIEIILVEARRE